MVRMESFCITRGFMSGRQDLEAGACNDNAGRWFAELPSTS
jgi:hypothetical protein